MHHTRSSQSQQSRFRHHASTSDTFRFFNLLTSPDLFDTLEASLPAHRERLFPPTETLSMFMAQALKPDRSCQGIVDDVATKRLLHGMPLCSTKTGAYCKARQRLPLSLVSGMVAATGRMMTERTSIKWRWHGRRVRLVDGTTVTLPDTPENQASYPQQSMQKPGCGFPICRIVALSCLDAGAVLNAAMGPFKGKGSGEQGLLRSLLDTLEANDLLLGDAFYATYFLLAELKERSIDAVFEQNGARKLTTDFRTGKKIGRRDHLITLSKPKVKPDWMRQEQYETAPDSLIVRELEVSGKILVTTLLCPQKTSKDDLKLLYKRRWQIELDIRNIKTILGMETLSCKTPEMGEKEMWVYLLAYNLVRFIMLQSALFADVLPRNLSFKHTLQLWLAAGDGLIDARDQALTEQFLLLVAERIVGNRPGRIEPRTVKRRPKPYPYLMQNRAAAREDVRKNGHAKKLK